MIWERIKYYIYAIVMFIITALGVYVKVLQEQKEDLKNEIENKEREIVGQKGQIEETGKARDQEEKQNDIIQEAEKEKTEVPKKVNGILEKSETEDIKITL